MEAYATGERWWRRLELVAGDGGGFSWWLEEVEDWAVGESWWRLELVARSGGGLSWW